MDDIPYLLRGVERIGTRSSTLVSSSPYLNHPRLREWLALVLLRRNGPDLPPPAEMFEFPQILREIRDHAAIEDLFRAERKINPKLDAWLTRRHLSHYKREDFAKYAPGSVGSIYYRYLVDRNFEVDLYPWREPETTLDYFEWRYLQTHDIEHILTGASYDYMGELIPYWVRIANHFKTFSPKLAGELSVFHLFGSLRYTVRTMLHYPETWPTALSCIQRGIRVGESSEPFYFTDMEDIFHLPLAEARKVLGIRNAEDIDTGKVADIWAEHTRPGGYR